MESKSKFCVITLMILGACASSCKKEAGEGGDSTINGRVYVKDYNASFTSLNGEFNGAEEDVYIIYGDDVSFGDRERTSYDGMYSFRFLQPGKYKIFAYSKDSTGRYKNQVNINAPKVAIIKEVEITKSNQKVDVENIVILD